MEPSGEVGALFLQALVNNCDKAGEPKCFDTVVLSGLKDIQGGQGKITCTFEAVQTAQNRYGTLHGGVIATIVDTVGSAALVTQSTRSGVSLSISVDYHSALQGGEQCTVTATVSKIGRTIAHIVVDLHEKKTRRLIASGRHTKFLAAGQEVSQWVQAKL